MNFSSLAKLRSTAELKSLKVACIMDEFSFETFKEECDLHQLTPEAWQEELESLQPQLLLIESAWRGKDELWKHKLLTKSSELLGIIQWCKDNQIPTAFWNKEDPVNFENFTHPMGVTNFFDYIFTTDIDSINRYKKALKHDRVFLLPFTFQPSAHNPIEEYEREDAVCFAGSYYRKYPKRAEDFLKIYDTINLFKSFDIYDRNHFRGDAQFQYPEHYHKSIKGYLPFAEIGKSYKGYNYGLTLNSVTNSQTMFARRALELIACNTSLISNYSRSLRLLFGNGVMMLGQGGDFEEKLQSFFEDERTRRQDRYHLLHHVMKEYTAKRGIQLIVECIANKKLSEKDKSICCISLATTKDSLNNLLSSFERQDYQNKKLLLVTDINCNHLNARDDILTCTIDDWKSGAAISKLFTFDYLAIIDASDYYGSRYLADSIMVQQFAPDCITCRNLHYSVDKEELRVLGSSKPYQWQDSCLNSTLFFPLKTFSNDQLINLLFSQTTSLTGQKALSLDIFNYCQFGAKSAISLSEIDPGESPQLIKLNELYELSLKVSNEVRQVVESVKIPGQEILKTFTQKRDGINVDLSSTPVKITSTLDPDKHNYINSDTLIEVEKLKKNGRITIALDSAYDFDLLLDIWFNDEEERSIARNLALPNALIYITPPPNAVTLRFALRIKGPGKGEIFDFITGDRIFVPDFLINLADNLFIVESRDDAISCIKEGRIKSPTEIFVLTHDVDFEYGEIGSSPVIVGGEQLLTSLLKISRYNSVEFQSKALEDAVGLRVAGITK